MHLQHLPMHRNPRQRSKRYIVPTWILCEVQVPQVSWLQRETFDKSLNIIYSCPLPPPPHIVRYTRYTCRMFQASESWVSNHNSLCCDAWGLCKLPKIIDIFLKCLKDKPFQLRNMQKKKTESPWSISTFTPKGLENAVTKSATASSHFFIFAQAPTADVKLITSGCLNPSGAIKGM